MNSHDLVLEVESAIRRQRLLRNGQGLVIAVSGGVDSMVLLHVLQRLAASHRWRLTVAHLNHRLRGRASHADERFVRRIADRFQLPCFTEKANVKQLAKAQGVSLEMAARELRHQFLQRVAREQRCQTIALAHHADDQVELFFLRLLRGSGSEGLAGMKWRNPSPGNRRLSLIRPLLVQPKEALHQYARECNVAFREDSSNAAIDIQRNRIRHELIPFLTQNYQPALSRIVLRQAALFRAESEFIDAQAQAWLKSEGSGNFDQLPTALQRRILHRQLCDHGVEPEFDLIEFLRDGAGTSRMIDPMRVVSRTSLGRLRIESPHLASFQDHEQWVNLRQGDHRVVFGNLLISWQIKSRSARPPVSRQSHCEWFDADRVGSRIILRHWRPGDRFHPIGMAGKIKLQDFFVNLKIPREKRRQLVVATTESGEIWWVEGLRISESFKLVENTRSALKWTWQRGGR